MRARARRERALSAEPPHRARRTTRGVRARRGRHRDPHDWLPERLRTARRVGDHIDPCDFVARNRETEDHEQVSAWSDDDPNGTLPLSTLYRNALRTLPGFDIIGPSRLRAFEDFHQCVEIAGFDFDRWCRQLFAGCLVAHTAYSLTPNSEKWTDGRTGWMPL